mgnify:CR=1 FL=1
MLINFSTSLATQGSNDIGLYDFGSVCGLCGFNSGIIIAFLLVYRLGESQLVKLASPFLLGPLAEQVEHRNA